MEERRAGSILFVCLENLANSRKTNSVLEKVKVETRPCTSTLLCLCVQQQPPLATAVLQSSKETHIHTCTYSIPGYPFMLRLSSYLQIPWSAEFVDSLIRIRCSSSSSFCSSFIVSRTRIFAQISMWIAKFTLPHSLPACLPADGGGLKGESVDYNF